MARGRFFTQSFDDGEAATLLGYHGMGKTTTVRSIMGLTRRGAHFFRGGASSATDRIARLGMALVPSRQIFPNLGARGPGHAFAGNRSGPADPRTPGRCLIFR